MWQCSVLHFVGDSCWMNWMRQARPDDLTTSPGWLYRPLFPKHWTRRRLLSLAHWVNGLAFRNIQFSSAAEAGKPVIKIAEIKNGISEQTRFTTQIFDDAVRVRAGDLLFSWSGQPESSIDAHRWRGPEGWLNQHVFRVTPVEGVDTTFLYHLLRYLKPHFVAIARNKQTTGLGHVTKWDLENMIVAVPSLAEQRAIAHVLGALDDKIDLNRRMNGTLEAMARALFTSWFVDFDPVRAKQAGRDTGLPADVADLFPDRLVDSASGRTPAAWRIGTLADVAVSQQNSADPAELPDDTCYIGLEHMPRRSVALTDWQSVGSVSSRKVRFSKGDLLFGKLRPYFHKVGVAPVDGVCSTDILVLRAKAAELSAFVLALLNHQDFVAYTSRTATGTKMPRTSWKTMQDYRLCVPPAPIARAFNDAVSPMLDHIVTNVHESRSLAAVRDLLLPRLMSGGIRGAECRGGRWTP